MMLNITEIEYLFPFSYMFVSNSVQWIELS